MDKLTGMVPAVGLRMGGPKQAAGVSFGVTRPPQTTRFGMALSKKAQDQFTRAQSTEAERQAREAHSGKLVQAFYGTEKHFNPGFIADSILNPQLLPGIRQDSEAYLIQECKDDRTQNYVEFHVKRAGQILAALRQHPNADATPKAVVDALMNNCRYNQYQYTTCDMEDGYPVGDSYTVTVGYYPESPHTRGSCIGQVTNFESAFAGLEKVPYKPAFSPELETAFIQEALPSAPNTVLFNVLGYQIQQQDKADPALTTQVLGEIKNPKRQYQQEEFDYLASEALPEMPDEVVTHVGRSAFGPSWTG